MTEHYKESPEMDDLLAEMVDALLADDAEQVDMHEELDTIMKTVRSLRELSDGYPGPSEAMSKRSIEIKQVAARRRVWIGRGFMARWIGSEWMEKLRKVELGLMVENGGKRLSQ